MWKTNQAIQFSGLILFFKNMASNSSGYDVRTGCKTPVSILQELLLKSNITPHYELIYNGVGTHEPIFKYKVQAGKFIAIGTGSSKKAAKHDAAHSVLQKMHYDKALTDPTFGDPGEDIDIGSPYTGVLRENVVGQLTELCTLNSLPQPEYLQIREDGPPHAKKFTMQCRVSHPIEIAVARTKKQAKHLASQQMINRLSTVLGDKLILPEKPVDLDVDEPDETPRLMIEGEDISNKHQANLNLGLPISKYHEYLGDCVSNGELVPILAELKTKDLNWIVNHKSKEMLIQEIGAQLSAVVDIEVSACKINSAKDSDFDNWISAIMKRLAANESSDEDTYSDSDTCIMNGFIAKVVVNTAPSNTFIALARNSDQAINNALINALLFYFFASQTSFDFNSLSIIKLENDKI